MLVTSKAAQGFYKANKCCHAKIYMYVLQWLHHRTTWDWNNYSKAAGEQRKIKGRANFDLGGYQETAVMQRGERRKEITTEQWRDSPKKEV